MTKIRPAQVGQRAARQPTHHFVGVFLLCRFLFSGPLPAMGPGVPVSAWKPLMTALRTCGCLFSVERYKRRKLGARLPELFVWRQLDQFSTEPSGALSETWVRDWLVWLPCYRACFRGRLAGSGPLPARQDTPRSGENTRYRARVETAPVQKMFMPRHPPWTADFFGHISRPEKKPTQAQVGSRIFYFSNSCDHFLKFKVLATFAKAKSCFRHSCGRCGTRSRTEVGWRALGGR